MTLDWSRADVDPEGWEPELWTCARVGHAWRTDGAPDVPVHRFCYRCGRMETLWGEPRPDVPDSDESVVE